MWVGKQLKFFILKSRELNEGIQCHAINEKRLSDFKPDSL